jgi:hypothetical protein
MDRNSPMSVAMLRSLLLAQEALLIEDLPPNPLGHKDGIQPGDVGYYSSGSFICVANVLPDLLDEKVVSVKPVLARLDHTFEASFNGNTVFPICLEISGPWCANLVTF